MREYLIMPGSRKEIIPQPVQDRRNSYPGHAGLVFSGLIAIVGRPDRSIDGQAVTQERGVSVACVEVVSVHEMLQHGPC